MQDNKNNQNNMPAIKESELIEYGKNIASDMPMINKDYDVVTAVRGLYLKCVESPQGNLLKICTRNSIEDAIRTMIAKQLNPVKNQCFPIAYGDKLVVQASYQGNIRSTYASNPNVIKNSIRAQVIRKEDTFIDEVTDDGRTVIKEHKLSPINKRNAANPIVGAYAIAMIRLWDNSIKPTAIVMTMDDIKMAWAMNRHSNGKAAQMFTEEMAKKTAVNRLCKWLRDSTDEGMYDSYEEYEDDYDYDATPNLTKHYDIDMREITENNIYASNNDLSKSSSCQDDNMLLYDDINGEVYEQSNNNRQDEHEENQIDEEAPIDYYDLADENTADTNYDIGYDDNIEEETIEAGADEEIEIHYSEYKNNTDKYILVPNSYNATTKTCKVKWR